MGRDVESQELCLEFDSDTHIWKYIGVAEEIPLLDKTIATTLDYLAEGGSFTGTATELSKKIERFAGEQIAPAVLSKKLLRYHSILLEKGWRFTPRRTRSEKIIDIQCVR